MSKIFYLFTRVKSEFFKLEQADGRVILLYSPFDEVIPLASSCLWGFLRLTASVFHQSAEIKLTKSEHSNPNKQYSNRTISEYEVKQSLSKFINKTTLLSVSTGLQWLSHFLPSLRRHEHSKNKHQVDKVNKMFKSYESETESTQSKWNSLNNFT